MKTCTNCGLSKPLTEYYKSPLKYNSSGYKPSCKICCKEKEKSKYTGDYHKNRLANLSPKQKQHRSQQLTEAARKRRQNPEVKLKEALRARIYNSLKDEKDRSTDEYLGCSIQTYKQHLENQFTLEMSWNNWGTYWEIDHIIPLSKEGSFHYTNTQPLLVTENRRKSNKLL
jgi:5-methylcytosine-specific restriction endonuclease McrA